jgi:Fe-S-cluster containining protein
MVTVDCTSCEHKGCCTYQGWKVFFLADERALVEKLYGAEAGAKITTIYSRRSGQSIHAVSLPCPFFEAGTGQCRIYDARPLVCRLFPVEIEPITETFYRDQSVCPERQRAFVDSGLVQIEVRKWCEKFWQTSLEKQPADKSPV